MRGEPVTILGGPTDDKYGDPVAGSGSRTVETLAPMEFRYSTESGERGRTGVVVGAKVYLPAGTAVTHTSQVLARGVLYDVDGDVADWRSGAGSSLGGFEVALKRAEG
jgi:hypothetical protein